MLLDNRKWYNLPVNRNIWREINIKTREYTFYWIFQILLPATDFLLSHLIPPEYKSITLIMTLLFPILVILPLNIAILLYKENKKIKENMRIYKAVYQALAFEEQIRDEYHRIQNMEGIYKVKGSDVWFEGKMQGMNVHPEGKISRQIKYISSSDTANGIFDIQIYDNIENKTIEPENINVSQHTTLHTFNFSPRKVGEKIDFTNKRFWSGGVPKEKEYIFSIFSHFIRGIDHFHGVIFFDRPVKTYWATTITKNGDIEEINVSLSGQTIKEQEFCYKLDWDFHEQHRVVIINFILPKSILHKT